MDLEFSDTRKSRTTRDFRVPSFVRIPVRFVRFVRGPFDSGEHSPLIKNLNYQRGLVVARAGLEPATYGL